LLLLLLLFFEAVEARGSMDTTAAAELGMGEPVGTAFWDTGPPGPDQWGDHGDDDSLDNVDISWDRPELHAGAASLHEFPQASHSSFGGKRTPSLEPPQKTSRTMPDESPQHSNEGPSHHSFSGGCSGHGGGSPLGRSNPSSSTAGVGSPNFGAVGSSPLCAGVVGRGRGMGSIFYKTKLCSRFRSGNCPYNTNCNFAHGMEELRKPPPGWEEFVASQEFPPPPSQAGGQGGSGAAAGSTDSQVRFHKTRPCTKDFGEGHCPYGEKCNFLHDEQSVPRVVREAREAVVAASGAVVAVSPKVETLILTTHGNVKETGGLGVSTPAGSATSNSRPSNWKTRFCNKWETTGHCPFRDKCYFAHGSDGKFIVKKSSHVSSVPLQSLVMGHICR
jgi:hypothetical protein